MDTMICRDATGALEVDLQWTVDDTGLRLVYNAQNRADVDLYVGLIPTGGDGQPRFGDVHRIVGEDGALHLDFLPPPVPRGVAIYARAIPLSIRVSTGSSVRGVIELTRPVIEHHAYCPPVDLDAVEPIEVTRINLRFWALREPEVAFARPVPGYDDLLRAGGAPPIRTTCAFTIDSPLIVLRRLDEDFWRPEPPTEDRDDDARG